MKLAIIGLGGVGGYFGGRLALSSHEVYFIARGQHLAAIRQAGLQVESELGNFLAKPRLATDDPAEVGEVDYVILATKAWQVEEAAIAIQPLVGPQTTLVPLLNGVEAPSQLAAIYGQERVLGGFCRVMSWILAAGKIHQGGVQPHVAFGEMNHQESERVKTLRAIFAEAGVEVAETPDILAAMWQKFLFIASFGGVGAVTRASAGVIRELPQTRQMILDCMEEIQNLAQAQNIHLKENAIPQAIAYVDKLPADAKASMQRDIMEGKPSELEAQNGAVARIGAKLGLPTPTHTFIYHALLPAELAARNLNATQTYNK